MKLEKRIEILSHLGDYLSTDSPLYETARNKAHAENRWFLPEFIWKAGKSIADKMLKKDLLLAFANKYQVPDASSPEIKTGIVFAGNIPYVGLHDLIGCFLFGYQSVIKISSKDSILPNGIVSFLIDADPEMKSYISISEMLKGCDAYLATGSNNSARYFEYYFSKYPHIIRKNKTSIAILDGKETATELEKLADDIQLYFGLGCRNVTQIFVPRGYDFLPLLNALRKYQHYTEHDKYKNNFDYQLTIAIMNNKFYMSNDSIVLLENPQPFSPISQLHYQFYDDKQSLVKQLNMEDIQCIVGNGFIPFGGAQDPGLEDFADGINTMEFLKTLTPKSHAAKAP
jgi:hypothetical protein